MRVRIPRPANTALDLSKATRGGAIGHRPVATTLRHYSRWVQSDEGDQVLADVFVCVLVRDARWEPSGALWSSQRHPTIQQLLFAAGGG